MSGTVQVHVPAAPIKLSDSVALDVTKIHAASWPGLLSGVLRNLSSEASRAVITRMHKEFAEGKHAGYTFVADTKANKDAGKEPTSLDDAKASREAWREANPQTYDAWMTEAESALVATIYDGSFRVREAGGPRSASLTPVEQLARDNGRMEFDTNVLPSVGITVPTDSKGKPLPPKHKNLAGILVPAKGGEKLGYADALERFLSKHKDRHQTEAKKEFDRKARELAKHAAPVDADAGVDL